MSKKVLLQEKTIRRFMKLANIPAVGALREMPDYLRDDDVGETPVPGVEDAPLEPEGELEEPLEPEEGEPEGEPGAEVDVQLSPEQVDALVDLGNQLEAAPEEPELEDEPEEDEPEGALEPELEVEPPEEELAEIEVLDDDMLVAEITKRVAKRLTKLSKTRK